MVQIIRVCSIRWHQWLAWQHFFRYFLFHVMASCFLSSSEHEIRQLLEEKDSKTHKKNKQNCSTSVSLIFVEKGDCRTNGEKRRFYVEIRRRFRYHVYFLRLQCIIKQLSDSVFVICKIINVSVRVICLAFGSADNFYREIDNSAYHKNLIQ